MTLFWVICATVFLLPVATPWGKAFLWSTVIVGALLVIVWAQHIYVTSRPEYTGSVNGSVGAAVMVGISALWVLGLAVRYVVWLFQLKREERLEKRQAMHQRKL